MLSSQEGLAELGVVDAETLFNRDNCDRKEENVKYMKSTVF